MICPQCEKTGQKSTVTPDAYTVSTLLSWSPGHYDQQGNYVEHANPNRVTQGFRCSNGHRFSATQGGK